MSKVINFVLVIFIISVLASSCKTSNNSGSKDKQGKETPAVGVQVSSPPIIIYKTKKDYYDKVPVILNAGGTEITSYPAPGDVYYKGKLAYPGKLADGFLLDNRGIGPNVAFTDITYEAYSKLMSSPDPKTFLFSRIADKDPLLEMYDCGKKPNNKDVVDYLNGIITSGDLSRCKKLK